MCRKLFLLASLVLVLGLVSSASAGPTWAGTVSSAWGNNLNWVGQVLPGTADQPFIGTIGGSDSWPLIAGETINVNKVNVGGTDKPAQMSMTGGSLTINSSELMLGNSSRSGSLFTITGGTQTLSSIGLRMGRKSPGRLEMSNNTMTMGKFKIGTDRSSRYLQGGRARIVIGSGADVTSNYMEGSYLNLATGMGQYATRINIGSGVLRIDITGLASTDMADGKTDVDAKIDAAIGDGSINAYGKADGTVIGGLTYSVIKSWDFLGGILEITAVPEPASVALLGLGGLALLRRRR